MAVVIAIDAGTTGVRALAVNEWGRPVARAYREFAQHYPRPGWVEHDAEEIWQAVAASVARVAGELEDPVAAIGITNQRETTVAWDRDTGRPLHRAIVWQDRRTAARCSELDRLGYLDLIRDRTGLVLDPYFSATKIEWLLSEGGIDRSPGLAFGTVDSWLLWCLTGGAVHATDPSNASRTLLFDIRSQRWDGELTELFHIPPRSLPDVRPSSARVGVTAERLGLLPPGVPISGLAGDQAASLFGHACFAPGMTKNTYGTGSFVLMNVGDRCPAPADGLLTSVAWVLERPATVAYALEGAIFATGATISWLRDLGIVGEAAEVGPLAESVDGTDGVYLVPGFAGLGSPWWDPYGRGTLVGVTRGIGRGHLARAAVEAMAYQTRDVVDAMSAAGDHVVAELRVDGGASVIDLLLQLQADQLGVPVARSGVTETTALGAAYLAGLAEGVWDTLDDVASHWTSDRRATPAVARADADTNHRQWRRALSRARSWVPPAERL
ncbi:MAG TPA: glycerol kinase GlpK [Acidimicrobiales bacterium]